jgi:hypothetical protein
MGPGDFYNENIKALKEDLTLLVKKRTRFAWLRFAAIAAIAGCFYYLLPLGIFYCLIPVLLLLILFIRLIFADLSNKALIEHTQYQVEVNEDELKALSHHYHHFPDGISYMPKEHGYANDLDIFGHASLYQYINRTGSEMGSNTLAAWLLNPATGETISARQEAIKELVKQTAWRQQLQAYNKAKRITQETKNRLENWFTEDYHFIKNSFWLSLRYIIPAAVIILLVLNITGVVHNYVRNYGLLGSALFALYFSKRIAPLQQQVSKITEELEVLSDSIQLIEQMNFTSPFLKKLHSRFVQQGTTSSIQINSLKKILERLDLRYNFVVFIPLDILLQWDLQQAIALEKWKQENHQKVVDWFTALGEFEAISSLATLSFNHPEWYYPLIKEGHFFMEGKAVGHPLIPADKRVNNPVKIDSNGQLMLVTGSNMAGKSTYLRSVGVNTVLAMAGAPVCAAYFCLSPVQLMSSMRIADNLEENTSTFYAELKKLKAIIEKVNNNEKIFVLLDEILRGTNSLDRHTGSAALIRQLIKQKAACIIATHDVELAKMKDDYPENILNFHFDVQVNKDELYFDYLLKEGICRSLNASILMKKIGIEL